MNSWRYGVWSMQLTRKCWLVEKYLCHDINLTGIQCNTGKLWTSSGHVLTAESPFSLFFSWKYFMKYLYQESLLSIVAIAADLTWYSLFLMCLCCVTCCSCSGIVEVSCIPSFATIFTSVPSVQYWCVLQATCSTTFPLHALIRQSAARERVLFPNITHDLLKYTVF